jgi:hypothetical protein
VKVVVDHFAAPDPAAGVADHGFRAALDGVRAGDTWVKLSAPYRQGGVDVQPYVDALLDAGGARQLVWASDWPFIGHEDRIEYRQCVDWLERWVPDAAARRTVLAETPVRLFHFDRALPGTRRARSPAILISFARRKQCNRREMPAMLVATLLCLAAPAAHAAEALKLIIPRRPAAAPMAISASSPRRSSPCWASRW